MLAAHGAVLLVLVDRRLVDRCPMPDGATVRLMGLWVLSAHGLCCEIGTDAAAHGL